MTDNIPILPPITSPQSPSLQFILELILTHGREEILIPVGLTGSQQINKKTFDYLQSFGPQLNTIAHIEGPFIDAFAPQDKYYVLWYKHEYDSTYATIQAQRKAREAIREEFNSKIECHEQAFIKFCKIHHHDIDSEYAMSNARKMFKEIVKWATIDDDLYWAEILKKYGYFDQD